MSRTVKIIFGILLLMQLYFAFFPLLFGYAGSVNMNTLSLANAGLFASFTLFYFIMKWKRAATTPPSPAGARVLFEGVVSSKAKNDVVVNSGLATLVFLSLGGILFFGTSSTGEIIAGGTLLLLSIESVLFLGIQLSNEWFKITLTTHQLVARTTNTVIVSWDELKVIEVKYNELFFVDTNGQVVSVSLDAIRPQDRTVFTQQLTQLVNAHRIHLKGSLDG